ncbi:ECF transporter S component [Loigolactobacillus coryniformis]|uniref:ECF transporter S component n=1 Tax=Loigolactobacillus coryniformis TaxID=1610 RepID=UPI001C5FA21F|nr:ECF transporter S component [Loigolactobacillus coryniformis]MBW4803194.1 ECF transporter S component [Loigolactobacillus coryniformis subsp. torquens]MBW4805889.1 ECF transporter S component [Loigolactobacillus coryniformis subsp. torquens]MDC4184970.1 ECF transporter S component [Loigolactobacillus coryniformis]
MQKNKAYRISILAMFIAIIIIQNFVPLFGYIPLGLLDLTTIHITVIIAAIILGPKDGALVGGAWGLITFIRAFTSPTSPLAPLVFTNPVVSIVPRILIGLVAGWLFIWLQRKIKRTPAMMLAALVGALVNTILVLGLIYLFYRTPAVAQAYGTADVSRLGGLLLVVVATNGIPEAILAAVVAPLICTPLLRFRKQR